MFLASAIRFTGGPRDQNRRYQDAMAIVRRLGKPSLFITMTCNPQWPEIVRNLPPGHKAENRPDLVARVFKLKLDRLLHELLNPFQSLPGASAWCQMTIFERPPHALRARIYDKTD